MNPGIPSSNIASGDHPMQATVAQSSHDQSQNILSQGGVPASPELAAQTPSQYKITTGNGTQWVFPMNRLIPFF